MLWEPAADPWAGSVPLASAALPLTAALHSPPLSRLELSNMRLLLGKQPVVRLYEPSEQIATRTLACRTRDAGEKLVASVRVTARLARDPEVSEQLLGALQPALVRVCVCQESKRPRTRVCAQHSASRLRARRCC